MKIQVSNKLGGVSEIMEFSELTLKDIFVILKYSSEVTITVKQK